MGERLKLKAEDDEDLLVLSAVLQDALLPRSEMTYLDQDRQFCMLVTRYCWETDGAGQSVRRPRRTLTAVMVDHVTHVRHRQLDKTDAKPLAILAMIRDGDTVMIHFADGASVALTTERLAVRLSDLTDAWPARAAPSHPVQDVAAIQPGAASTTADEWPPAGAAATAGGR